MSDQSQSEALALPIDESGITVEFMKYFDITRGSVTAVIFRIPDDCQILSRDPEDFMRWCYQEMMKIARQAKGERP